MNRLVSFLFLIGLVGSSQAANDLPSSLTSLIDTSCIHCHDENTDTDLRLDHLGYDLSKLETFTQWEKIFDRVESGEMPPEAEVQPAETELATALKTLQTDLRSASTRRQTSQGRVLARRLTKLELGYTLQDLLLIKRNVTSGVPEENASASFDNVGATQRISSVHIESYLAAADEALALAIRQGQNPFQSSKTSYAWLAAWHDKPLNLGGSVTRKLKHSDGIALFRDIDYLTQWQFNSNPYGGAPASGVYRLSAKVAAFQSDQPITAKIIVKAPTGGARLAKALDVKQGDPTTISVETFLDSGEAPYLTYEEPLASRGAIFTSGGAKNYKGPGLAIYAQQVEGPLFNTWPPQSTKQLLHGIEFKESTSLFSAFSKILGGAETKTQSYSAEATKERPTHVTEVVKHMAPRVFRRPVTDAEAQPFIDLANSAIEQERPILDVIRIPLRSMLGSPQFLLFDGDAGQLDDYALANRLSYFLWRSMPDEELFSLAAKGVLSDPIVLAKQVDRMLADEKSSRFVNDFVGQWLRLHKVNATTPDDGLYPEFDELLADSIPKETQHFFAELLEKNQSISNLIDSDFTMLNRRLAEHYGIEGIEGQEFRRVKLPSDSVRGGILTQAAILKTTANGTNTSPVMRGNFVLTSLLGTPPSPPPPNVGSIEPDTRGKVTIREILATHREIDSCNQCHREIDPPGFALESFDPIGGFRTHYRISGGSNDDSSFQQSRPARTGPPVDGSGVMPNGGEFADIREFKHLLMQQKEQIARHFISELVVFSTGAEIQFADRDEIETILKQARNNDFLMRDILQAVVGSKLFRHK